MKVVLISTYELGHQPFGLASPAAWLRAGGAAVTCLDLSREALPEEPVREAGLIAFYVPMHTATRLAAQLVAPVRRLNPLAHLCFYGLYAPVNEAYLRGLGVETILGGEFEGALAGVVARLENTGSDRGPSTNRPPELLAPVISLARLNFMVPDRVDLPALREYAHIVLPAGGFLVSGYTEASRGCKHLCRHCPIVPVYGGLFRVVQRDVVLKDIRRQVEMGAEHISFGDPDFFNGPAHAMAIVEALHREFPRLSYDVTIKIEHLLRHADHVHKLHATGCLFVTTAVESVDDTILARLDKGHTHTDFLTVVSRFRQLGLALQPTFVPFTPWTTLAGYRDLLRVVADQNLVENVAPVQLGIRLLIPAESRLLELDEVRRNVGPFDPAALAYPWKHANPRMDALAEHVQDLADAGDKLQRSRPDTFTRIWRGVAELLDQDDTAVLWVPPAIVSGHTIPHFSEPWYCCAEPTRDQFVSVAGASKPIAQPNAFL